MKYPFTLHQFPNSTLEIESSIWTGRPKIWKDGELLERSSEKGKPFLAQSETGVQYKLYAKSSLADPIPDIEIDGMRYSIVEKLPWYQYTLALLPMLLIFVGGGIGGALGALGSIFNIKVFRNGDSLAMKYLKVIGITVLSYALYILVAYVIIRLGS